MTKTELEEFRQLNIRIERAIQKNGISVRRLSNAELQNILINAGIMNESKQFLDKNGRIIIV